MMSDRFEAGASSLPSGSGPRVSNNGADTFGNGTQEMGDAPARHLDFAPDAPGLAEVQSATQAVDQEESAPREPLSPSKAASLQSLSKLNFNLKLRIFYLEERLAKLQKAAIRMNRSTELFEQKLLLDEKNEEIEERELLLVKARNAIESLQGILSSLERSLQTPKIGLHIPFPRNATSTQVKRQNLSKRQRKDTDERPRTLKSLMRAWKRF